MGVEKIVLKGHLDKKKIWPPQRVTTQRSRTNAPFIEKKKIEGGGSR